VLSYLPSLLCPPQALNRGKGLLPEPNILQLLNNLGPSASLQLLLNPLLHGGAGGKQGRASRETGQVGWWRGAIPLGCIKFFLGLPFRHVC
jgi:hypothetical protein